MDKGDREGSRLIFSVSKMAGRLVVKRCSSKRASSVTSQCDVLMQRNR